MLAALLLAQVLTLAEALPQGYVPTATCGVVYTADSNMQVDGTATTAGIYCVGGSTGCTIGHSESYGVEVTVSVGADLGLDYEGIGAAFSTEISYTTSTSSSDTGEAPCPAGPWTCGLLVTPSMLQVSGSKSYDDNGACLDPPGAASGDYTVQFPVVDADGNAVLRVEACTCPEQPNADVPGGPILCPGPCNLGGVNN